MDCVVQTWITGTITDALVEAVIEFGTTARASWLAIESQFRGNRETRALHLDAAFRNFKQGDLDITAYCQKVKGMADALRDLGEPVNDMTLVLNLLRGLNGRFEAIGLHLSRRRPFPTFLQARNDLILEELTMAESAPPPSTTALTATFGSARESAPTSVTPPAAPQQRLPNHHQQSRGGKRARRGKHGGGGRSNSNSAFPNGSSAQQQQQWPNLHQPWTGSINMCLDLGPRRCHTRTHFSLVYSRGPVDRSSSLKRF
ncbi:uncharacterized protein [Miscanthus floridulus]|uniref:uncharacterized protein n=1 Tax=Miscanthus floridulus TaxID=154761 RepID=UPI00345945D8